MAKVCTAFRLSRATALLLGWGMVCGMGCGAPPIKPVLTDPDPSIKIPAIEVAVRSNDRSAIPNLVKSLDSDDPAIRFYANDALKKLTNVDFGFLYYADEVVREPAVMKWRRWLKDSSTSPSPRTATQP